MPSMEDRIEEQVAASDEEQGVKMVHVDLTPVIKVIYNKIRSWFWQSQVKK